MVFGSDSKAPRASTITMLPCIPRIRWLCKLSTWRDDCIMLIIVSLREMTSTCNTYHLPLLYSSHWVTRYSTHSPRSKSPMNALLRWRIQLTSWRIISIRWKDYILESAKGKLVGASTTWLYTIFIVVLDLQQDYHSFGMSIQGLAGLETGISQQLHGFSEAVLSYVKAMSEMVRGWWWHLFIFGDDDDLLVYHCRVTKKISSFSMISMSF